MAALRTLFPLGTIFLTVYDTCMDDHNDIRPHKNELEQYVTDKLAWLIPDNARGSIEDPITIGFNFSVPVALHAKRTVMRVRS